MRILLLADIHIGSIKDTNYVYETLTSIIDKEIIFGKTDLVVILGDYFHRLFKVNEEYVSCAVNVMNYLIRACKRSKTKIRIVYGTESHEMGQYRLFNYHLSSKHIDMKLFDSVAEECIDGKNILYLPEEYINSKQEQYASTLYDDKKHYEYIFGHGVIEEGMPMAVIGGAKSNEKQTPKFKAGELSEKGNLVIFGHYHCYTQMKDNVYYLGSLFRDSFGEETPKGYGIIDNDQFEFIENKDAYVYKTYEFNIDSKIYEDQNELMKSIDKIKKENEGIFNGDQTGKIRMVFKTPENIDPSFRENLKSIIFNDKYIVPLIKAESNELIDEVKETIEDEYDFILDNSLPITDKIYRYINKTYESNMSLEELTSYINNPLEI